MSMDLRVYVGPYIEADGVSDEIIDRYESLLCSGRGELGVGEARKYLIPNCELAGVNRQMSFDRHDEPPVFEIDDCDRERTALRNIAEPFLESVRKNGGTAVTRWGVVCGVS